MENLKIYIDRLRENQAEKLEEILPPDFLKVDEKDLFFKDSVQLKGEVYLANDHLITHLNIETTAYLPCSICNDSVQSPVIIKNITLSIPLAEIKGAIFDITEEVRECILLQVPPFIECNSGKCPERENIKKFLKSKGEISDPIVHFPFENIDK
jgi:uncharacterized metal-binding protein YceD (DUF177 family)